jgi:hypothetical protein
MKKILLGVALLASVSFAGNGFMQMVDVGDMKLHLSSQKQLTNGQNKLSISAMGTDINDIKDARIKFFMPEMPGMPYMESKDVCEKTADAFECNVNFSMNGTWQYIMYITDKDGVKNKHRGSVNIGGSMGMHSDMNHMHH